MDGSPIPTSMRLLSDYGAGSEPPPSIFGLAVNQVACYAPPQCLTTYPENSAKEIKTIRTLLKTADIPVAEIAARFGVARSTLYRAVLNPAA